MKLKLCVLGNSHVGALKIAWDKLVDSDLKYNFDITFFASRAYGLSGLHLQEKYLVPTNKKLKENLEFTSNGLSFIDIEKYDLFLIYGLDINPYYARNDFFSSRVISQSIEDNYKYSLGYKLLKMICKISDKKVYLGHNPLPADKKVRNIKFSRHLSIQYIYGVNLVNKILLEKLNAELIHQPSITRACHNRNTHSKFSKGSLRLAVGDISDGQAHSIEDSKHMNGEFGKIWLEFFLNILKPS